MKRMKRNLAVLAMLAFGMSMSACGNSSAGTTAAAETPPETTQAAVQAPSQETIAKLSKWADNLYEPKTSITYPATIGWPADKTAVETAGKEVRPNTMFAALDKDLNVLTLQGEVISKDLAGYLAATKDTALSALYIRDDETAKALKEFLAKYPTADIFVAADSDHTQYVNEICDANEGVLGIIDWTKAKVTTDKSSLLGIVQNTNKAHAKIALIPESLSTYDAVEYLRGMLITVWTETSDNSEAIFTQLTNGVNGIVCKDYKAVSDAIESISDKTTLLRHVFITGHRGMPSQFIENTIRSERGAIDAGANVIECDISMSSDGVPFILHDDGAKRLFNRPDIENVETLTIAELQAMPFDMTDASAEEAPNSVLNANNTNRTKERREDMVLTYDPEVDRIPTLREYLEALNDDNIIHFIEIKSYNPEIVEPFKAIVEEMNMTDRVCVITFNDGGKNYSKEYNEAADVMKKMREAWPEMSLGYLGAGKTYWGELDKVQQEQGIGAAVGQLYSYLQPYNSTCNDYNEMMFRDVIFAARHRGLTSWDWTYNTEEMFAKDYLFGGTYSMTTNFSSWATHLPVKLEAADMTVKNNDSLVYSVIAQNGETLKDVKGVSLVNIDGVPVSLNEDGTIKAEKTGEAVVMLRLDTKLNLNDFDLTEVLDTEYALYSNPFTITVK